MKYLIPFLLLFIACKTKSTVDTETYSAEFNERLDSLYNFHLSLSPVSQTYEGLDTNKDKWDVHNDSTDQFYFELSKSELNFIQSFDYNNLNHQAQLTYQMYEEDLEQSIYNHNHYNHYYYPVNQMFGAHTWFPEFLMTVHTITNIKDAEDWLARLSKINVKVDELIHDLEKSKEAGIIAPKFVYPMVINDCHNLLAGTVAGTNGENPLLADFKLDLEGLDSVPQTTKDSLLVQAKLLLNNTFAPAYGKLITYLEEMEKIATDEAGVWKFPNGDKFYQDELKQTTTTNYSPDEIYNIGISKIERIHAEMEKIKEQVGFEGTLQAFFEYTKTAPELYYPNTDEGRNAYLQKNIEIKDSMEARLDELFLTKPKAALEVRRVEPYREQSAGTAFYNAPAPDGSRPGIYYTNLYDMNRMPKYEMEALTYHEAIPGHHMQLSIAQELTNLPLYRTREAHYTAYVEGWGLYSEYIPKEMGFYKDPYSDFGRLSMELFRAVRLVVDVGIHTKKWTREQGIAFYKENTPSPDGEIVSMVERHIVMPAQATAYKIGQLKILALRNKAQDALGAKFDIREFHDVVLTNGSVPLNILEELVNDYIDNKSK